MEFTNKFKVNKTLRFALKPIGETQKHIDAKGLLKKDEELAEKYKQAKKIIDEYHKYYINHNLSDLKFKKKDLYAFQEAYRDLKQDKLDESRQCNFSDQQNKLRKEVANIFKGEDIFKAKFIKKTLPAWLKENSISIDGIDNPQEVIDSFENWTSYFGGFNENRKNIYTNEDHSTSIGYRLIHDNLPKFLDNIERYQEAQNSGVDFSEVERYLEHSEIKLDKRLTVTGFNQCLTQEGIDKYNAIVGGVSLEGNVKQQGLNEKINLYTQQQKDNTEAKKIRSCKLEVLYKQILSDRNMLSFRIENIESDAELCESLENTREATQKTQEQVKDCLQSLEKADPEKIYIKNDRAIENISQHLFGNWNTINDCLEYYAETEKFPKPTDRKETKTLKKTREKWCKQSYFSFYEIHEALAKYFDQYADNELMEGKDDKQEKMAGEKDIKQQKEIAASKPLFNYFAELSIRKKNEKKNLFEPKELLAEIDMAYKDILSIVEKYKCIEEEKLKANKQEVSKIKAYLDALKDLQIFMRPLYIQLKKKDQKEVETYEKDGGFYSIFDEIYEEISRIIPLYNKVRNYLTKKPYSIEKYKLNFENETLADGWDENKETDNTCVILIKDGQYFLGVMDKNHKRLFVDKDKFPSDGKCYQKMVYKLLPGASKMLPKVFFSKKNIDYYAPSVQIIEIRDRASHTKSGTPREGCLKGAFSSDDMRQMIDFYKSSIQKHSDWKHFNFQFSSTMDYENINEFYKEVEQQGYKITFTDISESYIDKCINEGKLYLFQIYSKDFSPHSKGKPNLQTLYWKAIFEEQNRQHVTYKLDGEPELFHREASIKYSDEIYKKGHHADDSKKKQKYPIIKDRRYAQDTYLFHVPITCNFKADGSNNIKDEVNQFLKNNSDINIIGIDRGERHLAYYTVINQNGEILKDKSGNYLQGSLNNPLAKKDYQKLLNQREKERENARKSWATIERIKDLKEGYLSQVVYKISQLMVEHNAIVVFEDLNFGFKRGRFKIEKQVYQKLEKMLIDKLNYLIFKDKEKDEAGGLYNALQLTDPFKSFQKLGKQTGFIFYVPAYHTSKVCPTTGFVNLLYPRYETIEKAKNYFSKFEKISFNKSGSYFEFQFDYGKFTNKAEGSKLDWTVCSYGERLENFKDKDNNNQWVSRKVNLTKELQKLFLDVAIDYSNGQCIKDLITQQDDSQFFKSIIRLLRLTLQMRNSKIGTDEDWLVSPVRDKSGEFFDSRVADGSMPQDADANGAYHIALKSLMLLQQLNKHEKGNFKPDLSNKFWYKFVQNRDKVT